MAKPNMSRNQALAGQSVQQGSYVVTYNADGYATSAKKGTGGSVVSTPTNTTTTTAQDTNRISQDIKTSSGSSGSASSYTPAGAGSDYYAGQKMNGSDQALLKSYGDNWNAATTQEERDYWHNKAEELRASYGYQGGTDGSEYIDMMQQPLQSAQQNSGYDLTSYLRQIYANQLESQLAGLKVAYEKSMAGYDDQAARLPKQYDAARNSVAAQDALARKAFDERAAASGLSSGAAGQAELARSSAYQRDIASLDQAQANALSDIDLAKTNLQSQYESAIAQARADGNSALATALYQELVRVQGLNREDQQIAAAQEAANLELALKYGLTTGTGGTGSVTAAGTSASAVGSGGTSANKQSSGKGYDNGSLTAQQIKNMQAYYGLTQDGLWGPNSTKAAGGLSADEAWAKYLYDKYSADPDPDTSQRDNSAYWSSPYGQVLNDVQDLAKAGESDSVIRAVIDAARSGGRITQTQADRLKAQFVGK